MAGPVGRGPGGIEDTVIADEGESGVYIVLRPRPPKRFHQLDR